MVMTLNLNYWETFSLNFGCNIYSPGFHVCVQVVRSNHLQHQSTLGSDAAMFFRERDKPVVPAETFLATAVPKLLMGSLIVFLNLVAIVTMIRSNRNRWRGTSTAHPPVSKPADYTYALPQSTQGLLHSLFVTYLILGLLTLYSQVSLSAFLLGDIRIVKEQGDECLVVNSVLIALSLSIALHLVSLGVDRTLASVLPHQKYSSLARGTVPLWLLSIWLPSMILGALPLAGWKTNFSFCVFLLQFNDDYLRFVSGFFLTSIVLIPALYLFFHAFLRRRGNGDQPPVLMYRWHRKLQAHHRLTFALVLAVNTGCWTPFHVYLLLACQTCPYSALGSGFTLEYLFILALVPSLVIPLVFSLRSSFMDRCGNISRCVTFSGTTTADMDTLGAGMARAGQLKKNPLSSYPPPRPPNLFFINDLQSSTSSNGSDKQDKKSGSSVASFFVSHYLPAGSMENKKKTMNKFKSSFKNKYDSYTQNRTLPLRNVLAYLHRPPPEVEKNKEVGEENTYDSLESDFKYGFPIIPTNPAVASVNNNRESQIKG